MTFLVLFFGELLPMGFAVNRGVGVALAIAPTLLFHGVTSPLLTVLARLARMAPDRREGSAATITESEIRQLTAVAGGIEEHERQLIERAFRLDDTQAWDIMTPRVDVFAWRDDQALREIADQLGTVRFSRVPVYGETIDDITGVLYVRDAYQALISGQRDVPLRVLAREPLIVPDLWAHAAAPRLPDAAHPPGHRGGRVRRHRRRGLPGGRARGAGGGDRG